MKWGDESPTQHDLSSLRLLGIGRRADQPRGVDVVPQRSSAASRCPIVDTWWQTETGAIMISPLPGRDADQARLGARCRCPASSPRSSTTTASRCRERRRRLPRASRKPWPSMLRGIWGDRERYKETYWSRVPGDYYFAGDGARLRRGRLLLDDGPRRRRDERVRPPPLDDRDRDGAGARTRRSPRRRWSGDRTRSRARRSCAFVTLQAGHAETTRRAGAGAAQARGAGDRPDRQAATRSRSPTALPKTRSGKIMRRLLRDVAENRSLGDVTTLADPTIMNMIQQGLGSGADRSCPSRAESRRASRWKSAWLAAGGDDRRGGQTAGRGTRLLANWGYL